MKKFNGKNSAWCVTDGSAGMINQVMGLANAMQTRFELKAVDLKFPWNTLPVGLLPISKGIFKNLNLFNISNPPKYLISCGRKSVYLSLYLKRKLGNKIFTIHIQNPKVNSKKFDLVVVPKHDNLRGANVINTYLAINHINQGIIESNVQKFKEDFRNIEQPICTVLVGGKSNNYLFDQTAVQNLSDKLQKILNENNIKLVIIFSRRTNQFIINHLIEKFGNSHIVWTDKRNPYVALLGLSKFIICTSDSVSMISEAIYSKKSVFIFRLNSEKKNNRIENFNNELLSKGYAKLVPDYLEEFSHNYKNETEEVAKKIYQIYTDRNDVN